jgi:hypothetical protein
MLGEPRHRIALWGQFAYPMEMTDSLDDTIIETPDGPMTFAEWKKKNPVQLPSRRTKGKKLPNKVKRFTDQS